jgi:hypothetical protein
MMRRRDMLKVTGVGAVAALGAASPRLSFAHARRNLVLVYSPWGTVPEAFWPAPGRRVTDTPILSALAPAGALLTVVRGLAGPHLKGAVYANAMTAFTACDPFDDRRARAAPGRIDGPSLDDVLGRADALGGGPPVLRLATGWPTWSSAHDVCFSGDGRGYRPDDAGGAALGGELDAARVAAAVDAIGDALESRAARLVTWRVATAADARVAGLDVRAALAAPQHPSSVATLVEVQRFFASGVARLLSRLGRARAGRGPVLADTLVLWTSGMGSATGAGDRPIVLAGTAGGSFAPRGLVQVDARDRGRYGDLLLSVAAAVGPAPPATLGDSPENHGRPLLGTTINDERRG